MFRSATFRLTMWYVAIVVAVSLIFSAVVYHFATHALATGLHDQTLRIFREFPVFNNNPALSPGPDLHAGNHRILLRLIDFNIVVLLFASFASYFLARRTLEPIEAAHEQQKRFTADVSHELRTPLTALKMGSEVALIGHESTKPELRAALQSNLEEANKMEVLINNLLRLTKLDAQQVTLDFKQLSAKDLVEEALSLVDGAATTKHVTYENSVRATGLYGDRDCLVQLLVILLDNAIKYSPDKATIHVGSKRAQNILSISIRDEGVGINPEALPHVFERFYRADTARTAGDTDGYGLGLSIAKMIADVHNGTVTLSSTVGSGTIATLTLPTDLEVKTHSVE